MKRNLAAVIGNRFIAALDPSLRRLCYASYSGSEARHPLEGVAAAPSGAVVCAGWNAVRRDYMLLLQGDRICE